MRKIPIVVLCLFSISCAGSQLGRPKIPSLLTSQSPLVLYTDAEFQRDYTAYKSAITPCASLPPESECLAKQIRDSIINRIKLDIELNYRQYTGQLFLGRAGGNTALDTLELGLSTAATLVGASGTKTVLSGILTGAKGIRLSIDKNFFAERTTPIIIGRMEALRATLIDELRVKMSLSVREYPLEEAWGDLVELFYAGTLQGGIQALSIDMGQTAGEQREQRTLRLSERTLRR